MIESKIQHAYEVQKVMVWEREYLEQEARFVLELLVRWGMVAAEPDGEDSAGRQKLRLQTPEELTTRAFAVADLAMKKARKDGLVHVAPELPESEEYIPPSMRVAPWGGASKKSPNDTSS
ncbi:hypothetical protein LCGC14_2404040 [marine sediment metagenome]|uniref:Uncharacterized protein n=1 Tax=marine sediment metagenome TaxID=412755 RepID=A0A0F9CGJ1_9ZZZZ